MFSKKNYLPAVFCLLLAAFASGKTMFMQYNNDIEDISLWGQLVVWLQGLPLDIRTAAILLIVPALVTLQTRVSWRWLLTPYYLVVANVVAIVTGADVVMYEFWKFKLSAVVISYAMSPEGATSSVSPWFLLSRGGCVVCSVIILFTLMLTFTPRRPKLNKKSNYHPVRQLACIVVVSLLPVNVGSSFWQKQSLMRNHAATNPVFAFAASFRSPATFHYMPSVDARHIVDSLYTNNDGDDIQDTLLNTNRPNVLFIQMESFGGKFVKELGGLPDVAPELSRLIPQGVWWTGYYSNSFRTDRGTVALQSGCVTHPTVSLMRQTEYHSQLSSMPQALRDQGYHTSYMYAGAMTNMGKRQYLSHLGYDTLYDYTAFRSADLATSWGAYDETAAVRVVELLQQHVDQPEQLWMHTFQTISGHEPWVVPYHRLEDEKLNAFAYTDHVVGQLVSTLRNSPLWDNLLIIIIPDHGYLYEQTFEDPEFFHSPMLWVGGAVKRPRRMDVLLNQSDIAATLLAQMGLEHEQFAWSRNVLSRKYTRPSVYCNYPAGIMLKDATGVTIWDLAADKPITQRPSASKERERTGKALLQVSYEQLKQGKQ